MLKSRGLAASDVIRAMMRLGFCQDEIYDTLTSTGLPGEQVQLLMDHIAADFHEAKLESQPSRLGKEVREVFKLEFEGAKHELLTMVDSLSREVGLLRLEAEKLGRRILELQAIAIKLQTEHTRAKAIKQ